MYSEKSELRLHQERSLEALKEIDRIFRENDIEYYLLAGSCLGAVRHGGFIPWDDDIDIGIFYRDREKAYRLIRDNISEPYLWKDYRSTDNRFPRFYGKVLCEGKNCVDIFLLVKTSNSPLKRRIHWMRRKILYKTYKSKVGDVFINPRGNFLTERLKAVGAGILSFIITTEWIVKSSQKIESMYEALDNNQYYINFYSIYSLKREMIDSRWLFPKKIITFENCTFPTVNDTDHYLTNLYGDYRTIPAMEKRCKQHREWE